MPTFFRREDVIGKTVVDANGKILGKVSDIGFDIKGNLVIVIGEGDDQNYVFFSNIQAVGDVVILKTAGIETQETGAGGGHAAISGSNPTAQQHASQPPRHDVIYCPECGHPNPVGSKFCENCGSKIVDDEGVIGGVRKLFKR